MIKYSLFVFLSLLAVPVSAELYVSDWCRENVAVPDLRFNHRYGGKDSMGENTKAFFDCVIRGRDCESAGKVGSEEWLHCMKKSSEEQV